MNKITIINLLFLIAVSLFVMQSLPQQCNPTEVENAIKDKFDLFARGIKEKNIDMVMHVFSPTATFGGRTKYLSYENIKKTFLDDFKREDHSYHFNYHIKRIYPPTKVDERTMANITWTKKVIHKISGIIETHLSNDTNVFFIYHNGQWQLESFFVCSPLPGYKNSQKIWHNNLDEFFWR